MQSNDGSSTRCAVHPTTPAVFECARCGSFGCPECQSARWDADLCEPCARRPPDGATASWLAIAGAIASFLSFCVFPLAPVAFVLGVVALYRGSKDEGAAGGNGLAIFAITFAVLTALVWTLITYRFLNDPYAFE